jgi:hypothetical protein
MTSESTEEYGPYEISTISSGLVVKRVDAKNVVWVCLVGSVGTPETAQFIVDALNAYDTASRLAAQVHKRLDA